MWVILYFLKIVGYLTSLLSKQKWRCIWRFDRSNPCFKKKKKLHRFQNRDIVYPTRDISPKIVLASSKTDI